MDTTSRARLKELSEDRKTRVVSDGGHELNSLLRSRIAELERIAYDAAHLAATLATAETGYARGRIMSVSNMLNATLGRTQSSHGDQFEADGRKIEKQ